MNEVILTSGRGFVQLVAPPPRAELCDEFNQMLVEVEGGWEARLREEKEEVGGPYHVCS